MAKDDILKPEREPISLNDEEPIRLEDEDEPISLVGSEEAGQFTGGVKEFGVRAGVEAVKAEYKRPLNTDGSGATRCRIFHSKIAINSLEHMESQINEWIDGDQIEVKQVGHIIGTMEGKRPEPNLLLIVWY